MQLNEKGQGQEQLKVNVKGITGITASTSKGNQIKWRKGNLWIKADMQGYEGLAEEFASLVLDCTQIPHVRYKTCLIETSQGKYRGCCSQTMYEKGDSFYSISRLYETYGLVLERSRRTEPSIEIIENVIEFVKTHYMLDITDYLINTLYFDKLVANEDRHINNLGIIRKATGNYAIAPIFDNGLSFLAREEVWGKYDDFVYALNRVRYIPFGNKQVRALRKKYPNKKLIINKTKVYRLLNNYTNDLYPRYQVQRCKDILRWQLECSENCDNHFNFTSSNSNPLPFGLNAESLHHLLESRCFPRTRANAKDLLKALGLTHYTPLGIVKKTRGLQNDDFYWLRFKGDNAKWNDIKLRD